MKPTEIDGRATARVAGQLLMVVTAVIQLLYIMRRLQNLLEYPSTAPSTAVQYVPIPLGLALTVSCFITVATVQSGRVGRRYILVGVPVVFGLASVAIFPTEHIGLYLSELIFEVLQFSPLWIGAALIYRGTGGEPVEESSTSQKRVWLILLPAVGVAVSALIILVPFASTLLLTYTSVIMVALSITYLISCARDRPAAVAPMQGASVVLAGAALYSLIDLLVQAVGRGEQFSVYESGMWLVTIISAVGFVLTRRAGHRRFVATIQP